MGYADPKENVVSPTAGRGEFGNNFTPLDQEFQKIRMKLSRVLDGQEHLTHREVEILLARMWVGR